MANGNDGGKKRKQQRYLPHNKPVKKKGSYPLKPGVQGFFITCDGGREHQASNEAINVMESFLEDLIDGKGSCSKSEVILDKPKNKKITFNDSDSSDNEEEQSGEQNEDNKQKEKLDEEKILKSHAGGEATNGSFVNGKPVQENQVSASVNSGKDVKPDSCSKDAEVEEPPAKKPCNDGTTSGSGSGSHTQDKTEKSIDRLIEAELEELGDKSKRRFAKLDSGCNGIVIIQMCKRDGDPGPREIVQHMMESGASKRKHMSRFLLRVLPIEVSCYACEEEISRAIQPLITQNFPAETESPVKYAVLYDARANSGIDRMKIIDAVAKCVPAPHKVDLKNPEKNIVVQIVKTVCLIGVVDKYKEFAKYNFQQLTSTK